MATAKAHRLAWENTQAQAALSRYERLINKVARQLLPAAHYASLDIDDLRAEGRVAVLEALRSYKNYGVSEATWVKMRIRQRMIDAIRRMDTRTRHELSALTAAAKQGSASTDQQRALTATHRRLVAVDGRPNSEKYFGDRNSPTVDDMVAENSQRQSLVDAIQRLSDRPRAAIELGLFEGLSLREIGMRMGISESRVCQLQKNAVSQLRKAVKAA